jgi:hypothetical protein
MTLNGIQLPVIVREWSVRKLFKPYARKPSAVLGKKVHDARVYEVSPHFIEVQTVDLQQDVI